MTQDASFEDGAEAPLRLLAQDAGDVPVLSALIQDAIAQTAQMKFERKKRRFTLLLNRFRWEDADGAAARSRPFERVQSVLAIEGIERLQTQGIDETDKDLVLALLSIAFEPGDAPGGVLTLNFSGDGEIAAQVDCVDLQLTMISTRALRRFWA